MPDPREAQQILDQDFLKIRCLILDLAAALDRLDRAAGRERLDAAPELKQLLSALDILKQTSTDRAEEVQMHFSDAYEPGWNS